MRKQDYSKSILNESQMQYPSSNFMTELKAKLAKIKEQNDENVVFKKYDQQKGGFIEISKEERDDNMNLFE